MRVKVKRSLTPWTKKRKALVEDALEWGIVYLGDTEGVRLNVMLTGECSETLGDAYYDDVNTCTIRLNDHSKESRNRVLRTLFHEMWHIRQYLHEGLSVEATEAEFRGKTWNADYWSAPWEVEARKMEKKLVAKYNKYLDNKA